VFIIVVASRWCVGNLFLPVSPLRGSEGQNDGAARRGPLGVAFLLSHGWVLLEEEIYYGSHQTWICRGCGSRQGWWSFVITGRRRDVGDDSS
jgi:hypothetical protein